MQIYFHSRLWSYLPRVPILVEETVHSAYQVIDQYTKKTLMNTHIQHTRTQLKDFKAAF